MRSPPEGELLHKAPSMTAGANRWLPIGEEPLAPGSITHLAVVRGQGLSVLSLPSGEIDSRTEPSSGLFYQDTRHLSRLGFTFGGVAPLLLDAGETDQSLSAIFTNLTIRTAGPDVTIIPSNSLIARRRRVVNEALRESLTVSNYAHTPCDLALRIDFDADFEDIFVVRGIERSAERPEVHTTIDANSIYFAYRGLDGKVRTTTLVFSEAPATFERDHAVFMCPLQPGETRSIELCVSVTGVEARPTPIALAARQVAEAQDDFLARITSIETDSQPLNRAVERALLDIHALETRAGGIEFTAAGVPWFDTLFGRDSLITGMQLAAFAPSLLGRTLRVLAGYQSTEADDTHDASPGKLPHELRWGELANLGEVPFGRYYGSVDVTPLFIVAAGEYARWTGDAASIRSLWPNLERAMDWCITEIQRSPHGFLCYSRVSAAGLENQGWKDSHDCVIWPDGSFVEPPIALVEVQGYVIAAFHAYMSMAEMLDHPLRPGIDQIASDFESRFDGAFAHDEVGYAYCLDGNGRSVLTPVSNPGHLMWSGSARHDQARVVGARLLQPDMFSGWGIRTLSSRIPGYNPLGYHVGTIWPHDNSLIFAGLRGYGLDEQAFELGNAFVEAALSFPAYRIPELYSGDNRELRSIPTPYPVASRPQAWSAASLPFVMAAFMGLRPGAESELVIARPMLPRNVEWVRVRNLRVGRGSADLMFRSQGNRVSVEVLSLSNGLQVILSQGQPW